MVSHTVTAWDNKGLVLYLIAFLLLIKHFTLAHMQLLEYLLDLNVLSIKITSHDHHKVVYKPQLKTKSVYFGIKIKLHFAVKF